MIRDAVRAGRFSSVGTLLCEPLTDYLRYELGWSCPPNVEAGEEARCCPEVRYHRWYGLG